MRKIGIGVWQGVGAEVSWEEGLVSNPIPVNGRIISEIAIRTPADLRTLLSATSASKGYGFTAGLRNALTGFCIGL